MLVCIYVNQANYYFEFKIYFPGSFCVYFKEKSIVYHRWIQQGTQVNIAYVEQ